jgi:hypothetical protein
MDEARRKDDRQPRHVQPSWVPFAKVILLLSMMVGFFMLAEDMVDHHFFTGGGLNNPSAAIGP